MDGRLRVRRVKHPTPSPAPEREEGLGQARALEPLAGPIPLSDAPALGLLAPAGPATLQSLRHDFGTTSVYPAGPTEAVVQGSSLGSLARLTDIQGSAGQQETDHREGPAEVDAHGGPLGPELTGRIQAQRGDGRPLDEDTRGQMEEVFGHRFADVHVHADGEADDLNRHVGAVAFTTGTDIFFQQGAYQPDSDAGRQLLAHELTHVVQQRSLASGGPLTVGPADDAYEQEADQVANAVLSQEVPMAASDTIEAPRLTGDQTVERGLHLMPGAHGVIARDDGGSGPGGTAPQAAPTDEWSAERNEMETVRVAATVRQLQTEAFVGLAASVLTAVKTHLEASSTVYSTAYDRYAKVIAEGREAAKTEQELLDIGVGILFAVAIGSGVGEAALALDVGEGLAVEATKEAITATLAEGAKAGVKHGTGLLEVVGTDLQPGGLKPEVMQLHLWEQLVRLHTSALKTIDLAELQSLIASGAEYAIGEIKAQMGGGAAADMDVASLHTLIGTLANDNEQSAGLDTALARATAALQTVQASLAAAPAPVGREEEMERDIWLLWMADLSNEEAKVLDDDPIEKHLEGLGLISSYYGSGGTLGVDTGIWTTHEDCVKMRDAARGQAGDLKAKYGSITG